MAITTKWSLSLVSGDDSNLNDVSVNRSEGATDTATAIGAAVFDRTLAAAANVTVNLGSVTTARMILITTSAQINVRVGLNSNDPIIVEPLATGGVGFFFASIRETSIHIENTSATTPISNLRVAIVGV